MNETEPRLQKLSVLMPIYNERWTLREIVRRTLQSPVAMEIELVAVDDCSRDGSWELLQQLAADDARIKVFRHPRNRGKGAAIRTAIEQMTGDVAVIQDADLEYDPKEYPELLAPILEGKADAGAAPFAPNEAIEDMGLKMIGDAAPGVGDRQAHL